MRENSGKGDSHTGLLDPTMKERGAAKGRSGQAMLKRKRAGSDQRKPSPSNRGGGAR